MEKLKLTQQLIDMIHRHDSKLMHAVVDRKPIGDIYMGFCDELENFIEINYTPKKGA